MYNKIESAVVFKLGTNDACWSLDAMKQAVNNVDLSNYYTDAYKTVGFKTEMKYKYPDLHKEGYKNILPMKFVSDLRNSGEYGNLFDKNGNINNEITAEDVFYYYKQFPSIGDFLAYQLFVDFTYINESPVSENCFVVAGPGCKLGLDRIISNKSILNKLSYEDLLYWLTDNLEDLFKEIDSEFSCEKLFDDLPDYDRKFNVMSLENVFCEFSKYCYKRIDSDGFIKRKYKRRVL